MVPVDRNRVAKPISLEAPDGVGYREHLRAIAYYRKPATKAYPFKNYKEQDVTKALNTLFYDKCAYCEGKITHTGPIDVEHFRPKGKIEGEPRHKGYWWLATEWTNLLASCIDCNRGRLQTILSSEDNYQLTQSEQLSGKHNHFPVVGQRATCATDNHTLEDPLLIDPTKVDPREHIEWSIIADHPLSIGVSRYGQTSIELLGLNRLKLVEARRELQLKLDEDILSIKEMICNIAEEPTDAGVIRWMPTLDKLIQKFLSHKNAQKEFSAFASYIVDMRFEELTNSVNALLTRISATP